MLNIILDTYLVVCIFSFDCIKIQIKLPIKCLNFTKKKCIDTSKKSEIQNFCYPCNYSHPSRNSVSPVCKIFFLF